MSRENIDLVRSVLEPFGEIDVTAVDWSPEGIRETIERAHAPDVELRTLELGTGSGVGAIYRGCAGLVEYARVVGTIQRQWRPGRDRAHHGLRAAHGPAIGIK